MLLVLVWLEVEIDAGMSSTEAVPLRSAQMMGQQKQQKRLKIIMTILLLLKVMKHTSMSVAILYPAVCISDIINKAGMCSKRIECLTSQPFSALYW